MEIMRQVSAVLLVLALLGAALWTLRRGGSLRFGRTPGGPGRGRALESVERLSLTPTHALHLVRINGQEVVVATHPQGCALLTERTQ
jgi:flagellar biogenesis protein FliO